MTHPPSGPALTGAVTAIRELFSAAATSFARTTEDGEHLVFVAADGAGADRIVGVELPVGRGIAGFAAMSGQSIAVADVQRDPRFARDVAESTEYVPRTILAAPVFADGDVAGVLSVLDPAVDASSGWTLSVLGTLGTLVAALMQAPEPAPVSPASPDVQDLDLSAALEALSSRGPQARRLARDVLGAVTQFLDESDR
ncbi:MAG: GAF domain-containing protein [Actinomycetales bacterium]|nr:GAF domain-containing protein [Tetrasphaera sp.]NLW98689.1 GAF domain-containing protein [Actinomycetales bacterium]